MTPFADTLALRGLELRRGAPRTLQVNVGLLCDRACRHCHLEAGPGRAEVMDAATMAEVAAFARRAGFPTIDVTGGAPELVPGIEGLLEALAPLTGRLLFRCNLTAVGQAGGPDLVRLWRDLGVALVASLPSTNESQADAQRGAGVWAKGLEALRLLNEAGYGREGTGLELDLVANPTGAFLPPRQGELDARFRRDLGRLGVTFTSLFAFANVPLGRFRRWLEASGNLGHYLRTLEGRFNPCTVEGLMCRSLVSVAWDGTLYDCDFNVAAGLPLGGRRTHVSEWREAPGEGLPIATGDHCYGCTAGSGFT